MSSTRVYVGGFPTGVRERDVERFFEGFGRIKDILLKTGFGFVEFENSRDADDAVYQMNGKELLGSRVVVEAAKSLPRDRNRNRFNETSRSTRFGPPKRTEYRVIVENLSSSVSWQDLKDYVRSAGQVTYCDAHKKRLNEGVVDFASSSDMWRAIEKLDDTELGGRRIRLFEDRRSGRRGGGRRRSRSYSRSRSRYRSKSRSKSKSAGRSHSRSPNKKSRELSKSRSRSRSRKRSKAKSAGRSRSRSPDKKSRELSKSRSRSRSRKRSKSPRPSRSKRESRSPSKSRGNSRDRSRSRSPSNARDDSPRRGRSRSRSLHSSRSRRHPRSSARDSRDRSRSRSVSPRKDKDSRPMDKSMDD